MMASRRMPMAMRASASSAMPWPSGPRCTTALHMRARRPGSVKPANPTIPHMSLLGRHRFRMHFHRGQCRRRMRSRITADPVLAHAFTKFEEQDREAEEQEAEHHHVEADQGQEHGWPASEQLPYGGGQKSQSGHERKRRQPGKIAH